MSRFIVVSAILLSVGTGDAGPKPGCIVADPMPQQALEPCLAVEHGPGAAFGHPARDEGARQRRRHHGHRTQGLLLHAPQSFDAPAVARVGIDHQSIDR
jgi:hypothetical protein